jgi:hypothetical protein
VPFQLQGVEHAVGHWEVEPEGAEPGVKERTLLTSWPPGFCFYPALPTLLVCSLCMFNDGSLSLFIFFDFPVAFNKANYFLL